MPSEKDFQDIVDQAAQAVSKYGLTVTGGSRALTMGGGETLVDHGLIVNGGEHNDHEVFLELSWGKTPGGNERLQVGDAKVRAKDGKVSSAALGIAIALAYGKAIDFREEMYKAESDAKRAADFVKFANETLDKAGVPVAFELKPSGGLAVSTHGRRGLSLEEARGVLDFLVEKEAPEPTNGEPDGGTEDETEDEDDLSFDDEGRPRGPNE